MKRIFSKKERSNSFFLDSSCHFFLFIIPCIIAKALLNKKWGKRTLLYMSLAINGAGAIKGPFQKPLLAFNGEMSLEEEFAKLPAPATRKPASSKTPEDMSLEEEFAKLPAPATRKPASSQTLEDISLEEESAKLPSPSSVPQNISNTTQESDSSPGEKQNTSSPSSITRQLAQANDPYEQELYEMYTNYYSHKISSKEWENILNSVNADTYAIKKHDTLWDISKLLFNDSNYWPKLWSVNASITNPHLITPGTQLGFTHGTVSSAPALNIIDNQETQSQKVKPRKIPQIIMNKKIQLPPPRTKIIPVMNKLPSSLGPLYLVDSQGDETQLQIEDLHRHKPPSTSFLPYFMSSDPIYSIQQGQFLRKKDNDGSWAQTGEFIILQMNNSVSPGQKLIVAKDLGRIAPSQLGVRGPFGYQIEVQGEVEIKGQVPDSSGLYAAQVTQTLSPITKGSWVINRSLPELDFSPSDISGTATAQIIGFPPSADQKTLATPHNIIYLNRGSSSGLAVGQMYNIQANPGSRNSFPYGFNIIVGKLKISHTEERFATAFLTNMYYPIQVGDYAIPVTGGVMTGESADPFAEEDYEELDEDMETAKAMEPESPSTPPDTESPHPSLDEEDIENIDEEELLHTFE